MEPEFLIVLYGSNYKGFTTPSHHACTLCFLTYTACFCAKAQTHFALNAFKLFVFIFLKPFLYQLQLLRIPIEPAFGAADFLQVPCPSSHRGAVLQVSVFPDDEFPFSIPCLFQIAARAADLALLIAA